MKHSIFFIICLAIPGLIYSQQGSGTFTDSRDGHAYRFVTVGQQVWMAENLAYLPVINRVEDGVFDEERFWVYDYRGNNTGEAKLTEPYKQYGVLYNWSAALKACPAGWHLPSEYEWQAMELFLGMGKDRINMRRWRDAGEAGKKLKAAGGWFSDTGTDEYGFGARPGGCRGYNGFESRYYCGYFWTATPSSGDNAWRRTICFDEDGTEKAEDRRYFGCSVRCIKD